MKNIIILLIIITGISSCNLYWDMTTYEEGVNGIPIVSSINEAWILSSNIRYVRDGRKDKFKEPIDTYRTQEGDCEDIAAYMLALIEHSGLGIGLITIINVEFSTDDHAVVELDGVFYEAQTFACYWVDPEVVYRFSLYTYIQHRLLESERG